MYSKIFLKTGSGTTALKGMKFYEVSQTAEDLITYIKQKDSYCMQSHGHKRAFASLLILLFVYLKCYQRRLPGQRSDPSEDAAASAGMALCCTCAGWNTAPHCSVSSASQAPCSKGSVEREGTQSLSHPRKEKFPAVISA